MCNKQMKYMKMNKFKIDKNLTEKLNKLQQYKEIMETNIEILELRIHEVK